jgi:hypothetical protein
MLAKCKLLKSIIHTANPRVCSRMEINMELNIGEIVKLKKQHPCGSSEWEILRVGMDFRLKCLGCGHQVMLPRKQVEKNIKQVRKP